MPGFVESLISRAVALEVFLRPRREVPLAGPAPGSPRGAGASRRLA